MRGRVRVLVAALAVLCVLCVLSVAPAMPGASAQDTSTSGVPAPNIIPEPNQGQPPQEAGERGGALQLLVLAVIVGAIAAAMVHLTRQARRSGS